METALFGLILLSLFALFLFSISNARYRELRESHRLLLHQLSNCHCPKPPLPQKPEPLLERLQRKMLGRHSE